MLESKTRLELKELAAKYLHQLDLNVIYDWSENMDFLPDQSYILF